MSYDLILKLIIFSSQLFVHFSIEFQIAQKKSVAEFDIAVPGGRAGQSVEAVSAAGCYAPGGRYPLPSSVLMTALTARVAGVKHVAVASPRPAAITLAAAHVAHADRFLCCGGAQAAAALALGLDGMAT